MSQVLTNQSQPEPASAPATEASDASDASETSERKHRRLDLAKIALFFTHQYQWSYQEQQQMAEAMFTAMRSTFLARWITLGFVGVPLPTDARLRLRKEAQTQAAQIARTHNAALAQFIGLFTRDYITQHPEQLYSDGRALRAAIQTATRDWIAHRADWKPTQIAAQTTRQALSLADLYAGGSSALYTVDGPSLTERSCGICRTYYHQVIEQQQAWQLVFPAHPKCEHVLRQLEPDERDHYALTGVLP